MSFKLDMHAFIYEYILKKIYKAEIFVLNNRPIVQGNKGKLIMIKPQQNDNILIKKGCIDFTAQLNFIATIP